MELIVRPDSCPAWPTTILHSPHFFFSLNFPTNRMGIVFLTSVPKWGFRLDERAEQKKIKVWGLWAVSSYRLSSARICKGELCLTWVTKGQWLVSISVSGMLAAGCWFEGSQSEGQLQFWTVETWCSQIFSEVTCFVESPQSPHLKSSAPVPRTSAQGARKCASLTSLVGRFLMHTQVWGPCVCVPVAH